MRSTKKLKNNIDTNWAFEVVRARTYDRTTPLWTKSDKKIQVLVARAFPKIRDSERQREAAARWVAVIHLYFRMGYTRSQIAEELGSTVAKVHGVIRSILRVSNGLRADGSGKLGNPKGRPRRHALQ